MVVPLELPLKVSSVPVPNEAGLIVPDIVDVGAVAIVKLAVALPPLRGIVCVWGVDAYPLLLGVTV